MTGWTSGRRPQASRAVTRWIVAAHERHPDHGSVERAGPTGRPAAKPLEARPQPDVRSVRRLCLHPDQVLEGRRDRQRRAPEQELPRERRAVERTPAEPVAACAARVIGHGAQPGDRTGPSPAGVEESNHPNRWRSNRHMRRRLTAPLSLHHLLGRPARLAVAVPAASAGDPCYHDFVHAVRTTSASTTQVELLPCAFSPDRHRGPCRRNGDVCQRGRLHASRHGRQPGVGLARRRGRARQDRQLHVRPGRHVPVRVCAAPRDVRHDHRRRRYAGGSGRAVATRRPAPATASAEIPAGPPDAAAHPRERAGGCAARRPRRVVRLAAQPGARHRVRGAASSRGV